ncbi:hypothetical protein PtrM4_081880 [Pyrenophora tritici-repentis]|uniref:Heterokaryon incompatibility domain-containing protein n=1 Tax=Pyrenophora tritici-repentis TaxID=45151 RepID=A0A834S000_9PLEO|nr:hypothetical protein PtrM4_081880 [Pyrenophora tritici-repentis]
MQFPRSTSDDNIDFKYRPLDRSEPSIRLIQILPELSDDGRIQCTITHTTTSAEYKCLSYQWRDKTPTHTILIDGKIFTIPHNLFNFFTAAHDKAASEGPAALGPYWMDALCIDQSNVLERNHQVAQMSKIYAGARCVYIWLGKMDVLSIAPVIQQGNEKTSPSERFLRNKVACRDFITCVVGNGYWTRAWIIQEFMLASHIIVWLNDRCMTFADLAISLDVVYRVEPFYQEIDNFLEKWDRRSYQYGDLICMLIRFRHARCYDPRDRIFSLLSLVRGEGQDLQVDYGISRAELAAEVLRQSPSSFCFCTAVFVAQALGVEYTEPPFINPKTTLPCLELPWYIWGDPIGTAYCNTCPCTSTISISRDRDTGVIRHITYWYNSYPVHTLILPKDNLEMTYEGDRFFLRMPFNFLRRFRYADHVELCLHTQRNDRKTRDSSAGYPRICQGTSDAELGSSSLIA